jgi:protein-tyrosine phosphatase
MKKELENVLNLELLIQYPDDVKPEHHDEARAVHTMLSSIKQLLNKSK